MGLRVGEGRFPCFSASARCVTRQLLAGSATGFESNFRVSEILIRPNFCLILTLAAAGWLGAPVAVRAQHGAEAVRADSTQKTTQKVVSEAPLALRLPEVQVQAAPPDRYAVGSSRLVLDSVVLAQYRGAALAELLQARTPLYLKNYGPGQLASIALRGTSARHTAVLWQGFNINQPSLGEADFALLPVAATAQVAVVPGPAAARYGSGAIGGVVLLSSAPDWRPGLRASLQADGGSFGLAGGSLEAHAATARVALRVAAGYREAQNNYPYRFREARGWTTRTLAHAALRHQFSLAPELTLRLGQTAELTAAAWLTDTDRNIQTAVGAAPANTSQRDQSRRLLLGYRHTARAEWAVRGAWFDDVLDYRTDQATDRSRVTTTQGQTEYTRALSRASSLRVGAEGQHFAARIDGYRTATSAADVTENRAAVFALLRYDPWPRLRLSLNLRQAWLPGGAAPLTPTAGAEWDALPAGALAAADTALPRPAPRLTLRASAARSYRAPTLNERYWRPGGQPNLRPETGQGAEIGLVHRWPLAADAVLLTTDAVVFGQSIDDWVQWLPDSTGRVWSPRNLRQVYSRGVEASTALRWQRRHYALTVRAAYGYTATVKTQGRPGDAAPVGRQLPFVPLHQASFGADQRWRTWFLSLVATATAARFTDIGGTAALPAYAVLGATLGHTWPRPRWALTAQVQASNLLNQPFDSYPGRPASPRAAQASLRIDWH